MGFLRPVAITCIVEFQSIKDLVKDSETVVSEENGRQFEYNLDEKNAKMKLLKGAKRSPFEIVKNNGSINLVFNLGSWKTIVSPSILYWKQVKSEMTCKVGQSSVKLASVKTGRDVVGKHVDTQIIFFIDREKAVCHFYNTTQLILVNGHGYMKFVEEFLRPYFESKISMNIKSITTFNEKALEVLGSKKVKRASVRYKGGSTFPCSRCDFAAKTITTLAKHSREHALDNTSKSLSSSSLALPDHSTRNNSFTEEIMQENMTISNISLNNESLNQTEKIMCASLNCGDTPQEKSKQGKHVASVHEGPNSVETTFECEKCNGRFSGKENFDSHIQTHNNPITQEQITDRHPNFGPNQESSSALESRTNEFHCSKCEFIFSDLIDLNCHIESKHVETTATSEKSTKVINLTDTPEKMVPEMKCNVCELITNNKRELKEHHQTSHQAVKVDIH